MAVLNSVVALLVALMAWHGSDSLKLSRLTLQDEGRPASEHVISGVVYFDPAPANHFIR